MVDCGGPSDMTLYIQQSMTTVHQICRWSVTVLHSTTQYNTSNTQHTYTRHGDARWLATHHACVQRRYDIAAVGVKRKGELVFVTDSSISLQNTCIHLSNFNYSHSFLKTKLKDFSRTLHLFKDFPGLENKKIYNLQSPGPVGTLITAVT